MPNDSVQRSILRQGFTVLLLAFLTGFGIVAGGPRARGWMATHLTLMITAVFIVLVGLVWNRLVLSPRKRAVLRFAVVFDGYWGLLSGAFATIFAIPGPATGGGAQPAGWQAAVFFTVFIPVLTILPFVFTGLVLYGLRGSGPPTDLAD
ncbi:MAG: hypothetical protein QOI66_220 [Myxococcales bacterium]|jgi:hypothetical protein|nr:hypothetical protein [Myxococcales bacterium]